jgi:hypothetical protein
MKKTLIVAGVLALTTCAPTLAPAQQAPCMPYADMIGGLAKQYEEMPTVEFDNEGGPGRYVVFASPKTNSVTVVGVRESGGVEIGCIVATGSKFRPVLNTPAPGTGS